VSRGSCTALERQFLSPTGNRMLVPKPQADCHESVTSLQNSCRRAPRLPRSWPPAISPVTPGCQNCVKRFKPFLHYPNKWKTSRCGAMSHGSGPQPGNPWLGSSRVPEPTGKRLRRFVSRLLRAQSSLDLEGADRFVCPNLTGVPFFPCAPPAPSRRPDTVAAVTRL
jgi:hypothetical protein